MGKFLLLECSPVRKTNMFENADLYRTKWRKRYSDVLFCYRTKYTFLWRTGEHHNYQLQIIFQQCETMGSCLLNFF